MFSNIVYIVKKISNWNVRMLFFSMCSIICDAIRTLIDIFILKYVLDFIMQDTISVVMFLKFILKVGGIKCATYFISRYANVRLGAERVLVRLKFIELRMKSHMQIGYEKLENPRVIELEERAINATRSEGDGVAGMVLHLTGVLRATLIVIVTVGLLSNYNIIIVFIVLVGILTKYFITNCSYKYVKKNVDDKLSFYDKKDRYFDAIAQDYGYGKDIRLLDLAKEMAGRQKSVQSIICAMKQIGHKKWMQNWSWCSLIDIIQNFVVYSYLIMNVYEGKLTLGDFVLFLSGMECLNAVLSELLNSTAQMQKCSRMMNDYRMFIEECNDDAEKEKCKKNVKFKNYSIEFKNVSFKYPGTDKYIINNLSLFIPDGKKIALVGANGAGKTTLIKLACGLYTPTSGSIEIGGVDIGEVSRKNLYGIFAPVFQDNQLFSTTIEKNVSMTSSELTDMERVTESIERASFSEKVAELHWGKDTQLTKILHDDGIDISGGEKQKLSLARALYKNASILILDEPTAAMDPIAESKLYDTFESITDNRTTIYISHRLSSTKFCDKIYLIEDGGVKEEGTHAELMNEKGCYAQMFIKQAENYMDTENEEYI